MEYRRLGRTEVAVSIMGLGSGGRSQLGQASGAGQREVDAVIRCAFDHGINLIDTAPGYGASEELLGRALSATQRSEYVLCTKFKPVLDNELEPESALRASLERSLVRLRTDAIDVLYLHGVTPRWFPTVVDRFVPALEAVRRDGLIRFAGITEEFASDHEHETLRLAADIPVFDVMMMGYNLMSPAGAYSILPLAAQREIGVVIMCAVRGALLNPDRVAEIVAEWKRDGSIASDALPDEQVLEAVLGPLSDDIASTAYRFATGPSSVGSVLTGTGNPDHLERNVAALKLGPLDREITERIFATFGPVGRNVSF